MTDVNNMEKIRKGVMVDGIFYGLVPFEEFVDSIKEGVSVCDICDLKSECSKDEQNVLSSMCHSLDETLSLPSIFKKV